MENGISRPVTLYRLYRDKELLYVGISSNFVTRFNEHRKEKKWWLEVDRIVTEHFESRERALNAEQIAIKTEKPLFNVIHNKENVCSELPKDLHLVQQQQFGGYVHPHDRPSLNTDEFLFGDGLVGRLWLYPEISYSSILCDYFDDDLTEDEAFSIVCDQIKKNTPQDWENDSVPIFWSVCGIAKKSGGPRRFDINEWAPFSKDSLQAPDMPNFLTRFGWPNNYRFEKVNWYSMPVQNHRFPKFAQALEWTPAPYQETAPMRTLQMMRNLSKKTN